MSTSLHLQSMTAANDLARRYLAHASGNGARLTQARPPLRVVAMKPYPEQRCRAAALRVANSRREALSLDTFWQCAMFHAIRMADSDA